MPVAQATKLLMFTSVFIAGESFPAHSSGGIVGSSSIPMCSTHVLAPTSDPPSPALYGQLYSGRLRTELSDLGTLAAFHHDAVCPGSPPPEPPDKAETQTKCQERHQRAQSRGNDASPQRKLGDRAVTVPGLPDFVVWVQPTKSARIRKTVTTCGTCFMKPPLMGKIPRNTSIQDMMTSGFKSTIVARIR